ERELTRQKDLALLVRLAGEFDDQGADSSAPPRGRAGFAGAADPAARDLGEFVAHLEQRFGANGEAVGVHLLTYHRAKGLEFEAVFLPRLEERELPSRLAKTPAAVAEERRLLYVGMTRAKKALHVTWAGKPSRFLEEPG